MEIERAERVRWRKRQIDEDRVARDTAEREKPMREREREREIERESWWLRESRMERLREIERKSIVEG